jgi:hypothetical protein
MLESTHYVYVPSARTAILSCRPLGHAKEPPMPSRSSTRFALTDPPHPTCPPAQSPEDVARYIGQLAAEMAAMARGARLDLLAYLLEMARVEASSSPRPADRG